jgi:hypothetical protein
MGGYLLVVKRMRDKPRIEPHGRGRGSGLAIAHALGEEEAGHVLVDK